MLFVLKSAMIFKVNTETVKQDKAVIIQLRYCTCNQNISQVLMLELYILV